MMKIIAISFILFFICALIFFIYMMAIGHGLILILPSFLTISAVFGMISGFDDFVGKYSGNINYNRAK